MFFMAKGSSVLFAQITASLRLPDNCEALNTKNNSVFHDTGFTILPNPNNGIFTIELNSLNNSGNNKI